MKAHVEAWLACHCLSPQQIDCVIAVMLKILDGKCKMKADEKVIMAELYQQVKHLQGILLGSECHHLISVAVAGMDEAMKNNLYEMRVLAETRISRPVMKKFKTMIREQGLVEIIALEHEQ
ncbi:hypothetical protein [Methylophaga sp.]|uniref:hypothetical protein n=1 Tax=Methylophaga sp. TaxID=2024840 RepID=UPI002716C90B|nr:hypothetical protein [Methylophaga sp.]MDO8828080.1 hypothetical protein [Methylophaga sp.]